MSNTPTIETERLILRRFTSSDLEALFAILKDPIVNRFLPWFPVTSLAETKAFYEQRYAPVYQAEHGYAYAICLKEDNVPIGYVNIGIQEPHDLGYALSQKFWHQGITSEAAQAVVARAKADGIPYITATHDRLNPNSGLVMRKLGMSYRYSYEELWMPKKIKVIFRLYQINFTAPQDFTYQKYWEQYHNHFVEQI